MAVNVNPEGVSHAKSLAHAGKINRGAWDASKVARTPANATAFLGVDPSKDASTEGHWKYPVTLDGEVYSEGVTAAEGRSEKEAPEVHKVAQEVAAIIKSKTPQDSVSPSVTPSGTDPANPAQQTGSRGPAPKDAKEHNKMLRESSVAIPVWEHYVGTCRRMTPVESAAWKATVSEAQKTQMMGAGDEVLYDAKWTHADKKNQNARIYPMEVVGDNVDRLAPGLSDGHTIGAMDHQGYWEGGNFGRTAIVWRDLALDRNTGEGNGKFAVVPTHEGKNLQAMIDSKLGVIGFSTYGYGTGHEPGKSERERYGLGEDEDCTIMDPNYELKKIDCVDDPSVYDAKIRYTNSSGDKTGDKTNPNNPAPEGRQQEQTVIETLDQLKTQAPKAFAAHEAALKEHKDSAKKLADAINPLLPALKENALISLPQREVAPAEFQQAKAALETKVAGLEVEKTNLTVKLAEAEAKLAGLQAQVATTDRVAKVLAKAGPIIKDNSYKAVLREELTTKATADATFTEATVEAYIDTLCVRFDKISGRTNKGKGEGRPAPRAEPALGQQGVTVDDEDLESAEGAQGGGDDEFQPAPELAEAFGKRKPRAAA